MKVLTAYIEITNQCNLNCCTCYNQSGLNRNRQELSVDQLESIITLFQKYGCHRFLLSGGEPLLHSEFGDILSLIESFDHLSFGISTNGTIMDSQLFQLLQRRKNFLIQISLDGSCEKVNALTRGANNFEKTVSFVRNICQPDGQKPRLKMVLSRQNADDLEAFYKLAISLNCLPEFAFVYRSGNSLSHWEEQDLSNQQKISLLQQVEQLNNQYNLKAVLPLCTLGCPLTKNIENLSICIKTDGSIFPCQALYDTVFDVGNVLSFDEEEFVSKLYHIANIATKRQEQDYGCVRCLLRNNCLKGCMATAIQLHGDPLDYDEDCLLRRIHILKKLKHTVK